MRSRPLSPRGLTLLIAGLGALGCLVYAALATVPYVALMPGPTLNTLGRLSGKPLIQISGARTYPTSGHLNMVTVSYTGGPGSNFSIFAALTAWLNPHDAVVPEQELFPPNTTQQQVERQDTEQMATSQQTATAAALCQLHIGFQTIDTVAQTVPRTPARSALRPGDIITAVDGTVVNCRHDAATLIRARSPGSSVVLTIDRGGATRRIRLRTIDIGGTAVVGIRVRESYKFPFSVRITVGDIGGPSAGLMFALGIYDKLTRGDLGSGHFIAGTGVIDANGTVQPIGGIQQKMVGARAAGATVFLAPAANCADTRGAVPAGLKVVKVSSLAGAIADLRALRAGRRVASC